MYLRELLFVDSVFFEYNCSMFFLKPDQFTEVFKTTFDFFLIHSIHSTASSAVPVHKLTQRISNEFIYSLPYSILAVAHGPFPTAAQVWGHQTKSFLRVGIGWLGS